MSEPPDSTKSRYYLSLKAGIGNRFHAMILRLGAGVEFSAPLESLEEVQAFLEDVRPISWVSEFRWDNADLTVISERPEPLTVLIGRAVCTLDPEQSFLGHADLMLGDRDPELLHARIEKWKRT